VTDGNFAQNIFNTSLDASRKISMLLRDCLVLATHSHSGTLEEDG
jgi:hypothetical protein